MEKLKKYALIIGSTLAGLFAIFFFFFKRNRTQEGGLKHIEVEKEKVNAQLDEVNKQLEELKDKKYSDEEIEKKYN